MVEYIKYTPEVANDWKQAIADVSKDYPYLFKRVLDCSTSSQLQSKLWAVNQLKEIVGENILRPRSIVLLGGWYANFSTELLMSNIKPDLIQNFEIDEDVKYISYKFNKRYKDAEQYKCDVRDIMWDPIDTWGQYEVIINTSCEHMFPMTRFYSLNKFKEPPVYVLQSTDDTQWDDHINCVSSSDELIEQARITKVLYSGEQELDNGMKRFMVIGYPAEEGYRNDEATDSGLV